MCQQTGVNLNMKLSQLSQEEPQQNLHDTVMSYHEGPTSLSIGQNVLRSDKRNPCGLLQCTYHRRNCGSDMMPDSTYNQSNLHRVCSSTYPKG